MGVVGGFAVVWLVAERQQAAAPQVELASAAWVALKLVRSAVEHVRSP